MSDFTISVTPTDNGVAIAVEGNPTAANAKMMTYRLFRTTTAPTDSAPIIDSSDTNLVFGWTVDNRGTLDGLPPTIMDYSAQPGTNYYYLAQGQDWSTSTLYESNTVGPITPTKAPVIVAPALAGGKVLTANLSSDGYPTIEVNGQSTTYTGTLACPIIKIYRKTKTNVGDDDGSNLLGIVYALPYIDRTAPVGIPMFYDVSVVATSSLTGDNIASWTDWTAEAPAVTATGSAPDTSKPLTMGTTFVAMDPTTGYAVISTSPSPQNGVSPSYTIYRSPNGNDSTETKAATVTTLPYTDTESPNGILQFKLVASDSSVSAPLDGGWSWMYEIGSVLPTDSLTIDTASHAFVNAVGDSYGLARMDITGAIPIDQGAGKTKAVVQFSQNGHTVFTYNISLKVSGQSTATDNKRGYSGSMTNATGQKAHVKFGSWEEQTKLSLKAYYDERSLCRDIVANRLFKQIFTLNRPDTNMAFPIEVLTSIDQPGNPPMGTDGFPVKLYMNGNYQGLYISRTSGSNSDWLIDDSNPAHYFLQFDHAGPANWVDYDWTKPWQFVMFDVIAPTMSGYSNQTDFSTTYPTQYANCAAPFNLISDILLGNKPYSELSTLWDVTSIATYLIASEITMNADGIVNNAYFCNWGGKWFMYWYDLDETFGQGYKSFHTADTGLTTKAHAGYVNRATRTVFDLLWENDVELLQQVYARVRDGGVGTESIMSMFYTFASAFGPSEYENETSLWGRDSNSTMSTIRTWLIGRFALLDSTFNYAGSSATWS